MSGFLIVFSCSFYVVFELEVGVGNLFFWFIEEVVGGGSMGEKREEGFVFSFVFSFLFAYKLGAFAHIRNSIRFCAKLAQNFFIFLILGSETLKFKNKKTSIFEMKVLSKIKTYSFQFLPIGDVVCQQEIL